MARAADRTSGRADDAASIGSRIAQLRKERGLAQKELAERLAVTQSTVSQLDDLVAATKLQSPADDVAT